MLIKFRLLTLVTSSELAVSKAPFPCSSLSQLTKSVDPDFYEDGNPFYVWANQYKSPINESRVVQTARAFVHGYLYEFADTYGTVVSVNSTGSVNAIGNSLGPSDSCPKFGATSSGGNNVTDCGLQRSPAAWNLIG